MLQTGEYLNHIGLCRIDHYSQVQYKGSMVLMQTHSFHSLLQCLWWCHRSIVELLQRAWDPRFREQCRQVSTTNSGPNHLKIWPLQLLCCDMIFIGAWIKIPRKKSLGLLIWQLFVVLEGQLQYYGSVCIVFLCLTFNTGSGVFYSK